jgi:hypothetical protein
METVAIQDNIALQFPPEERDAARIIENASRRSIGVIRELWGLELRGRCRVQVMTSPIRFIFRTAPWYILPFFAVTLPLWFFRIRRSWRYSGGWSLLYRNAPVVGIKPARLLLENDRSLGILIFGKEPDLNRTIEHITCHELTHAFSAHLRLPVWLNEGIAMMSVDSLLEKQTVRQDTLALLEQRRRRKWTRDYRDLQRLKADDLVYHYVRGYWITRFFSARHPELLKGLLTKKHRHKTLEKKLARALGLRRRAMWKRIDAMVVEHFRDAH